MTLGVKWAKCTSVCPSFSPVSFPIKFVLGYLPYKVILKEKTHCSSLSWTTEHVGQMLRVQEEENHGLSALAGAID